MNCFIYALFGASFLLLSWLPGVASAHEFRPGHLQIVEVEEASAQFHVIWKKPILLNTSVELDPIFSDECTFTDVAPPKVGTVALIYHWRTDCDLAKSTLEVKGLPFSHTDVLVSLATLDGERASYVLRPDAPSLDLREQAITALSYFVIGVEHLVFGIDHVLFVIGLFLFIRDPIALIKTITAFTLSHSITLALSVLEIVKLDQAATEAVIALSIFFLARELVQAESERSRLTRGRPWIMAFVFGLLHGLGFAGALADIGLPKDDLWVSLLLFNLGIEAGQVAVIMILAGFAWLLSRIGWRQPFNTAAAWSMGCLATFWTIDRTVLLF
jgi:hydrogenase/urease accessory protein HupE